MSGKSLPKPSSKTALNKKYQLLAVETKGRLDTATENGRANINLLQKYYNAFSNLYGAIILDDAWDIFKILEKKKITKKQILKKDFLFFSEVARYEEHNYFVLEIDELYEAEERGSAARRFILNKKLYKKGYSRFDSYYRLADEQLNHPLCVLDRDELLSWNESGMLWRSAEGAALKLFVENLSVDNKSVNQDINGEKIAGKLLKDFIFWHDSEKFAYSYAKREWEKKELEEYQNVDESEKILRLIEQYINSAVLYTEINKQIDFVLKEAPLSKTGAISVFLVSLFINTPQLPLFLSLFPIKASTINISQNLSFKPATLLNNGLLFIIIIVSSILIA